MSPRGRRFDARLARELAARPRIVFLCGRYEGLDERVRDLGFVDEEISAGDFVLSGGEVAALLMLEAISRFVPGVVGDAESVAADSFEDGLLDFPHYTRPREFRGVEVPEVLLSGHHARIKEFRRQRQFEETARHRPDLWNAFQPANEEKELWLKVAGRVPNP
jgi:tRNA (guanine37-N1)-methyltransferase